jgi:hypothetical protein
MNPAHVAVTGYSSAASAFPTYLIGSMLFFGAHPVVARHAKQREQIRRARSCWGCGDGGQFRINF